MALLYEAARSPEGFQHSVDTASTSNILSSLQIQHSSEISTQIFNLISRAAHLTYLASATSPGEYSASQGHQDKQLWSPNKDLAYKIKLLMMKYTYHPCSETTSETTNQKNALLQVSLARWTVLSLFYLINEDQLLINLDCVCRITRPSYLSFTPGPLQMTVSLTESQHLSPSKSQFIHFIIIGYFSLPWKAFILCMDNLCN